MSEEHVLTSSDRLGRGASSGFVAIFCLRLSLLAGRACFCASWASLVAERLALGVPACEPLELPAIVDDCCEPDAAWSDVMEDDDVFWRAVAVAGGVARGSMAEGGGGGRHQLHSQSFAV